MEDANSKRTQAGLKPTTLEDFIQNPLNKHINPRNIVYFAIEKKRAKSLTRKIDEHLQVERKTPLVKSDVDIIRTPEQILQEMSRQDHINKKDKKLLKEMLYTNPIPDELRRKLWFTASGARVKREQEPDYYRKVSRELANYPTYFEPIIELDLKRTFPDRPYDPKDQTIEKMRHVLNAYAKRNPFIGYCQGMNFIIARIIEVVQDEEESFWILCSLLEDLLPIDYFSSMVGVLVDQKIFAEMLLHHDKELGKKFSELEVDLSLFSLQWFVCCYVSTFSKKLCHVVWDLLFIEGGSILFKTGLVFLSYLKQKILYVKEFNEVFGIIEESSIFTDDIKDFLKRLQQVYISKRLLRIIRKQYQWITEEELHQVESKKRARPQPLKPEDPPECKSDWPVCLDVLDKSKQKKRNPSVLTFRADRRKEPKGNYLTTEFKHTHYHKNQLKKMIMNKERGRDFHVRVENTNTPSTSNFLFDPKSAEKEKRNKESTVASEQSATSETRKQNEFNTESIRVSEDPLIVQSRLVIGRHHHTCNDVNRYKKQSVRKQASPQRARKTSRMEEYVKSSLAELRDSNSPALVRPPNTKFVTKTENKIPPISYKSFTVPAIEKPVIKQEETGVGSIIRGLFGSKNIKSKEENDKRYEKRSIMSPSKDLSPHSPHMISLEGGEMPRKAKVSIYDYIMESDDLPNYEGKGIDSEKKSIMFMREFFKE